MIHQLIISRCYCGNTVAFDAKILPDTTCRNVCSGDYSEICGGRNSLSMYQADKIDIASIGGPTIAEGDM